MLTRIQDLNDALIYVRVVETGSFTAAGSLLNLPRSSVSRKVSRLEEQLGVRLLHRTTRSLSMTPAGQTFFDRASRAFNELDDVGTQVAGLAAVPRGRLRVTAPVSFLETARGVFPAFLAAYPEIRMEVDLTDRFVDIVEEGFDLAIRGGKPPDPSLDGCQIYDSRYELLASTDYLRSHGYPSSVSELRDHQCLILGLTSPAVWRFETSRGPVEVTVNGRLASTNVMALLEATRAGMGISRLPTGAGRFDMIGLERILPELRTPGGGLWAVYPSSRHLSPAVRAFIEFVEDQLAQEVANQ